MFLEFFLYFNMKSMEPVPARHTLKTLNSYENNYTNNVIASERI